MSHSEAILVDAREKQCPTSVFRKIHPFNDNSVKGEDSQKQQFAEEKVTGSSS